MVNKALFIEQLKRFWAIPAIAAVLYVIVYVMAANGNTWSALRNFVDIITMGNTYIQAILVLTPVATAFCVFSSFFHRRSVTAFYSMPLSRNQIFATNAAAGIVLSVLPIIFFCAVMLLPLAFQQNIRADMQIQSEQAQWAIYEFPAYQFSPQWHMTENLFLRGVTDGANMNTLPVIGGLFLRMLITSVFYFGVAWLAISLAGHGFTAILLVGALPFLPAVVVGLADLTGTFYIFGYRFSGSPIPSSSSPFLAYHNPAAWAWLIRPDILSHTQAIIIPSIIYIVLGAAIFAGAFFISRARKPERTGNPIMFAPVKNVLVFLLAFAVMIFTGVVFLRTSYSTAMLYIGFAVGFAIGYVVAQMIAEKSFHIVDKLRYFPPFAGAAVAVYVVMLIVTQFGAGFFINRIPHPDEIYGVHVSAGGRWMSGISHEGWLRMINSDPEFIAETRAVHQTILDGRRELHSAPFMHVGHNYVTVFDDGRVRSRESLFITYLLHDGSKVVREYSLPGDFIARAELEPFLTRSEVILAMYSAFKIPEIIESITIIFDTPTGIRDDGWFDSTFESAFVDDPAQIAILLEAIADGVVETEIAHRADRALFHFHHHERALREWRAANPEASLVEAEEIFTLPPARVTTNFSFDWSVTDRYFIHHMWGGNTFIGDSVDNLRGLLEEMGIPLADGRWHHRPLQADEPEEGDTHEAGSEPANAEDWQIAYAELLRHYAEIPRPEYYPAFSFILHDINRSGTPELLITYIAAGIGGESIYTFRDGEVIPLEFYDGFFAYFGLFVRPGANGIITQAYGDIRLMQSDGAGLISEVWLRSPFFPEDETWYINGAEVTRDEYDEMLPNVLRGDWDDVERIWPHEISEENIRDVIFG
ncbi:MAG: hypothetical protein FWC70_09420 [Defluviitaleaceae bacterium]|nr:hypothetical protein [Defluviitaleaceae bacterium]